MSSHMCLEMRAFSVNFLTAWMLAMMDPPSLKFWRASSMRQKDSWRSVRRRRAKRTEVNLLGSHLRGSRVRIWRCWRINNGVVAWWLNDFELMVVWAVVACERHAARNNRDWINSRDCCSVRKCGRKRERVHIGDKNLLWDHREVVHVVVIFDDHTVLVGIVIERKKVINDVGALASEFSLSCNERTHCQWRGSCALKISFHFPHCLHVIQFWHRWKLCGWDRWSNKIMNSGR